MMQSYITGGPTAFLFSAEVLGKYTVSYYRCLETGFIQVEKPYWLEEAYSSAITALDLGIVSRNIEKANLTARVVHELNSQADRFLDFGGGYGIFTRLMRDRGYDFVHHDMHCRNLFAQGFELTDIEKNASVFDLATAWEVFEHVTDARELVRNLSKASKAILFSTELVPANTPASISDWWYFTPETGQHVSFYTRESLDYLGRENSMFFYTDGTHNHLFTRERLHDNPFEVMRRDSIIVKLVRSFLGRQLLKRAVKFALPRESAERLVAAIYGTSTGRYSLLQRDYELTLDQLRKKLSARP